MHRDDNIAACVRPGRVIYLSPDAPDVLDAVHAGDTFIVGGIVDRQHVSGASLVRARQCGHAAMALPLGRHGAYKGQRVLTLVAVCRLLHHVAVNGDWTRAIDETMPQRCVTGVRAGKRAKSEWDPAAPTSRRADVSEHKDDDDDDDDDDVNDVDDDDRRRKSPPHA